MGITKTTTPQRQSDDLPVDAQASSLRLLSVSPGEAHAPSQVDEPPQTVAKKPKLARRFVVYNDKGESFMRLDREQRCSALRGELGRSVECSVYEDRPAVCRRFEAGSEGCLKSRAERGITD